jgi:fatty-acyl-CoA synthase
MVESDGSIHLLGRGSVVINTGGEKVFPEEVEEVLKLHPDVRDAIVVGIPDDRFGQAITAVVELMPGTDPGTVSEADLIQHIKKYLASYKAPRRVRFVPSIGRAPTGKVDYSRHASEAAEWARGFSAEVRG